MIDGLKEKIPFLKNKEKEKELDKNKFKRFSDSTLYTSDYYFTHDGIVGALMKLQVQPGTNRNLSFRQILNLLPKPGNESNVKLTFMVKDKSIKGDEKTKLVNENAIDNMESMEIKEGGETSREQKDKKAKLIKRYKYIDYGDYQLEASEPIPVILYDIYLLAESYSQYAIKEQIDAINTLLDKTYAGLKFYAQPGVQMDTIQEIYKPLAHSLKHKTSTGSNYALLNFAISRGLKDQTGVPIGLDSLAITSNSTLFDFNKYTTEQAFIAIPKSSILRRYNNKNMPKRLQYTTSSYFAQAAANNISANNPNSKIYHIVLNNYNYIGDRRFYLNNNSQGYLKNYDMTKLTINPLQGFGDYDEVQQVYTRLLDKVVNIFDILNDFKIPTNNKTLIRTALDQYFFNINYWSKDIAEYPKRARIIKVKNPETYPTLSDFINQFTIMTNKALREGRELKADRVDDIEADLTNMLSAYSNVIGSPTSIDIDKKAKQLYYKFNNIGNLKMKQIQFLNIFEYLRYIANPGDTIIIHGMNNLFHETTKMVHESVESAKRKGIKMIYAYDTVTSPSQRIGAMSDLFKMNELYYENLNTNVDWVAVGRCNEDEVKKFEKALRMRVGPSIGGQMQARAYSQVLIHRDRGHIDHFTSLDFII